MPKNERIGSIRETSDGYCSVYDAMKLHGIRSEAWIGNPNNGRTGLVQTNPEVLEKTKMHIFPGKKATPVARKEDIDYIIGLLQPQQQTQMERRIAAHMRQNYDHFPLVQEFAIKWTKAIVDEGEPMVMTDQGCFSIEEMRMEIDVPKFDEIYERASEVRRAWSDYEREIRALCMTKLPKENDPEYREIRRRHNQESSKAAFKKQRNERIRNTSKDIRAAESKRLAGMEKSRIGVLAAGTA
jgi:hypothetical protein